MQTRRTFLTFAGALAAGPAAVALWPKDAGSTELSGSTEPYDSPAVRGMPATDRAMFDAADSARVSHEWRMSGKAWATRQTARSSADLSTMLSGCTPGQQHLILLAGSPGDFSSDIEIPAKDMGTGGVLVEGNGIHISAKFNLGHFHGLQFSNIVFVHNEQSANIIFNAQEPLLSGSTQAGRKIRWEGCKFGLLFSPGKSELDWQSFPTIISCFHAEQIIFEDCSFWGIEFGGGIHGVDLFVSRNCDFRTFLQSIWTGSEAYYPGRTKDPVVIPLQRTAFLIGNTIRAQWDRADLLESAGISDVFHTDIWQFNPPNIYGWRANSMVPVGVSYLSPEGIIFERASSPQEQDNGEIQSTLAPAVTRGAATTADGVKWIVSGPYKPARFSVIMLDNIAAERAITKHKTSQSHGQLAFMRDSSINHGNYLQRNILIAAGNIIASSTAAGLESMGSTQILSSHNTFSAPPMVASNPDPNVVIPAAAVIGGSGSISSFHDIINASYKTVDVFGRAPTGSTTIIGQVKCSGRRDAPDGTHPSDVFTGPFTKSMFGEETFASPTIVNDAMTSRSNFIAAMIAQLTPKDGINAGAIHPQRGTY